MAELRVGHDQISLTISNLRFTNGEIQFQAVGYPLPSKLEKLTGSQPIVLVGDDGKIVSTWHDDLTELFAEVRKTAYYVDSLTVNQSLKFDYTRTHLEEK